MNDVITLVLVFTCSYGYMQNPYLAAKLVEIMYVINPAVQPNTRKLGDLLLSMLLAVEHLVPALMSFYTGKTLYVTSLCVLADIETTCASSEFCDVTMCVLCRVSDIETTGASSEFYDKFTIRYHLSIIFKSLWAIPMQQMKFIQEAK